MKEKLYCIAQNRYAFRLGEPAEIIGFVRVKENNCYHLRYGDGVEDFIPVNGGYEIELKTLKEISQQAFQESSLTNK